MARRPETTQVYTVLTTSDLCKLCKIWWSADMLDILLAALLLKAIVMGVGTVMRKHSMMICISSCGQVK